MPSILRPWVEKLGLRHQGALLTAVRGCDTAPKLDASKALVRVYRSAILEPHCGDPRKAVTFIEWVDDDECMKRMEVFRKNCDHYPAHYVHHMIHCAEIIGYKGPRLKPDQTLDDITKAETWLWFYHRMVSSLHLRPETEQMMDDRLNANETTFAGLDRLCELEKCP